MGINARSALHPSWSKHNEPVVGSFMGAEITITRKAVTSTPLSYNQATGVYTGGSFSTVFTGKAIVQPYGLMRPELLAQEATDRTLVRFQIEGLTTGINQDDVIEVTSCDSSPELLLYTFTVLGAVPASLTWITDVIANADAKHA